MCTSEELLGALLRAAGKPREFSAVASIHGLQSARDSRNGHFLQTPGREDRSFFHFYGAGYPGTGLRCRARSAVS